MRNLYPLLPLILFLGCSSGGDETPTSADGVEPSPSEVATATPISQCNQPLVGAVVLPEDDGIHNVPMEWWYWTGHLQTSEGEWFGFLHVVFLIRLSEQADDVFMMAHHALTDIEGQTFQSEVTTAFGAPPSPETGFDWQLGVLSAKGGGGEDQIHGEAENHVMDLSLTAQKRPVLQHEDGYIAYDFGGDTYYYSRERMGAAGTLKVGEESHNVTGEVWFDHQWGELSEATTYGWDWFAIQLEDGREIMAVQMNAPDGGRTVEGSVTDASCQTAYLDETNLSIESHGQWTSTETGCIYPQGWTIDVDGQSLDITPYLANQEMAAGEESYWEGAAEVGGDGTGRAYVELAGYCRDLEKTSKKTENKTVQDWTGKTLQQLMGAMRRIK